MTEDQLRHHIISKFFQPEVCNMGGGLRIIELPSYITVEERDLIVKALKQYRTEAIEIGAPT